MSWNYYPLWGWGYDEYDAFRRRRDADHERARQREEENLRERRRADEKAQALKKHQQEVAFREKRKALNRTYDTTQTGHTDSGHDSSPSSGATGIISSRTTKLNRGGFFEGSLGVQTNNATSPQFSQNGAPPQQKPQTAARCARRAQRPALNRAGFFDGAGVDHGPAPPGRSAGSTPGFFDGPAESAASEPPATKGGGAGLVRAGFTAATPQAQTAARNTERFVARPEPTQCHAPPQRVETGATTLEGTSKIGGFIRW